jgi:endonuclease V-like protein UPF0215 family
MMTKFKVGDKVRIVDISKVETYLNETEQDVFEVRYVNNAGGIRTNRVPDDQYLYIASHELPYIELVEESPSTNERITALESQVAELHAELQTLKKRKKPKHLLTHYPTPNEQRKAIIERAKSFITETQRKQKDIFSAEGNDVLSRYITQTEFVINQEKRTVVAIIRGRVTNTIYAKGIAKCAPDDVFNADIGKAIALGRALGLDVSEFEYAVKPTEVVVGMVVESAKDWLEAADGPFYIGDIFTIVEKIENHRNECQLRSGIANNSKITVDSEAQY